MKQKVYRPCQDAERVILAAAGAAGPEGVTPGAVHEALAAAWVTNWPDVTEGMIRYLAREGVLTEGEQDRWVLRT